MPEGSPFADFSKEPSGRVSKGWVRSDFPPWLAESPWPQWICTALQHSFPREFLTSPAQSKRPRVQTSHMDSVLVQWPITQKGGLWPALCGDISKVKSLPNGEGTRGTKDVIPESPPRRWPWTLSHPFRKSCLTWVFFFFFWFCFSDFDLKKQLLATVSAN